MAHNSIGLDLGSSEVRAAVVQISLRSREIIQLEREPVQLDETGASSPEAVLEAAGRLMKRINPMGAGLHCAITGELASIRKIILPAGAAKRLDQVLKFELDEVLPFDIEDAVFDYVETAHTADDLVVLTASVLHEKVEDLIVGLESHNIAPREIGVDTFAYLNRISTGNKSDAVTAFVDIGHSRTSIAVLDHTEPTIRTVLRGGRQLTVKLSEVGGVDFEKAEAYKREFGLTGQVGEVLRESLRPMVRELQQTFKGHLAAGGRPVTEIKLCGGGALLLGLDRYLSENLGIPVEIYQVPVDDALKTPDDFKETAFALAYMLALREEVPRARRINIRRGSLAFKGDYQELKRRVRWLALGALAVVLSWAFSGYASFRSMESQVESRREELAERTEKLFGAPLLDADKIEEKLKGTAKEERAPIPKMDAFDIINELSKRIPASIVHDVEQLEIKQKRVTLKGLISPDLKKEGDTDGEEDTNADEFSVPPEPQEDEVDELALSPTDLLKQKLEEFTDCFTAIRMGRISTVNEKRRYQMDIDSRCP